MATPRPKWTLERVKQAYQDASTRVALYREARSDARLARLVLLVGSAPRVRPGATKAAAAALADARDGAAAAGLDADADVDAAMGGEELSAEFSTDLGGEVGAVAVFDDDDSAAEEAATPVEQLLSDVDPRAELLAAATGLNERSVRAAAEALRSIAAVWPMYVLSLLSIVIRDGSRGAQLAMLQGATAAVVKRLEGGGCPMNPKQLEVLATDMPLVRPLDAFLRLQWVPVDGKMLVTAHEVVEIKTKSEKKKTVFGATAQVPYYEPADVIRAAVEAQGVNPDRAPMFTPKSEWCGAPASFTASHFARELRKAADHQWPVSDGRAITVLVEVAYDESLRNTFQLYAVRLRVRQSHALDRTQESPIVLMLPVQSCTSFTMDGAAVAAQSLPDATKRELVGKLQREALKLLLEKLAALHGQVLVCRYGMYDVVHVRPVFAVVTADSMVGAPLAGVLRRFTAMFGSGAAYLRHYSSIVVFGDDDAHAAGGAGDGAVASAGEAPSAQPAPAAAAAGDGEGGPSPPASSKRRGRPRTNGAAQGDAAKKRKITRKNAALRDEQFPSDATLRTDVRDREYVALGADEARKHGIDKEALEASPLNVDGLRLFDMHNHLATDGMHTFDGCVGSLYRLLVHVFSESVFDEAARRFRVSYLGRAKVTLFVPIADRMRDVPMLAAAVAVLAAGQDPHYRAKSRDANFEQNALSTLQLTVKVVELLAVLTDYSPGLLVNRVETLCADLRRLVETELPKFPREGTHHRFLTVKMALLIYSAFDDLALMGAHADTSTRVFETLNKETKAILTARASNRADSHRTVLRVDMLRRIVHAYENLSAPRSLPTSLRVSFALLGATRTCDSEHSLLAALATSVVDVVHTVFRATLTVERAANALRKSGAIGVLWGFVRDKTVEVGSALRCKAHWGEKQVVEDEIRAPLSSKGADTMHAVAYDATDALSAGQRDVPCAARGGADTCTDALCLHHRAVDCAASRALLSSSTHGLPLAFVCEGKRRRDEERGRDEERLCAALVLPLVATEHRLREHYKAVGDFVGFNEEQLLKLVVVAARRLRGSRPLAPKSSAYEAWYSNVSGRWLATNL